MTFDLIDIFNNTSRYLDDIFAIDNPEFDWMKLYFANFKRLTNLIQRDKEKKRLNSVLQQKSLHPVKNEKKKQLDNTKTPPQPSITKRLRTDLGRSV